MPTDDERREVARRLRACESHIDAAGWFWLNDELCGAHVVASSEERLRRGTSHLADLIDPPYPDAMASYKGWRAEVYDPDGALVSPSNLAVDLVRAHADGKAPSEPEVRCVAEVKVDGERLERLAHDAAVEVTGIDRDAPREERRHDG